MSTGYLAFVLHAHLPYVRHPEHETFLEEQWLFEAITETYVPLLRVFERLEDDGVDYAFLVSLSPTLVTMLRDPLLQQRYAAHLDKQIALADREIERLQGDPVFEPLARWYADLFRDIRFWYEERYARDLVAAFQRIASFGHVELMTCAATHGFLPLLKVNPGAVKAQVHTAVEYHQRVFGVHPQGIWVPECAYYPGLEEVLAEAGIRYFFVDTHAIDHASEKSRYGVYAPLYTPTGWRPSGATRRRATRCGRPSAGIPAIRITANFIGISDMTLPKRM